MLKYLRTFRLVYVHVYVDQLLSTFNGLSNYKDMK